MLMVTLIETGAAAAGWTVVDARWRPDANPNVKDQVWESTFWSEGWSEKDQYYPRYAVQAGSVHVILRNDSDKPQSISLTGVDGFPYGQLTTSRNYAGKIVWYRVESPRLIAGKKAEGEDRWNKQLDVPPGEWVECTIRLRDFRRKPLDLKFVSGDGSAVNTTVQMQIPRLRVESISFSPKIDKVYLYIKSSDASSVGQGKVSVDGKPISDVKWAQGPAKSGLAVAEITLSAPLAYGSYHLLTAQIGKDTLAQPVRAWDSYYSIGLFEIHTTTPEKAASAKAHGFNTLYWGDTKASLDQGFNHVPAYEPGKHQARTLAKTGVLFNYNMDEPDCSDWSAGEKLPPMKRLGVQAQPEVLPRQREQLRLDPTTPAILLVDNTFKPANWYVYGQIPDVFSTDSYVPLGGRQVDYVWQAQETARDACAPRPLVATLWACGLRGSGAKSMGNNPPTPEEGRMMVFYAVGSGAKGISYFCNLTDKTGEGQFTGLMDVKDLYEEIGRANHDVTAISPYLSIGCPIGVPEKQGKAWVRALMCGRDKMVVVAVNTNHYIGFETKYETSWNIPAKDVVLSVPLPAQFGKVRVQEVQDGKLVDAKGQVKAGKLQVEIGELVSARAFVVTKGN